MKLEPIRNDKDYELALTRLDKVHDVIQLK